MPTRIKVQKWGSGLGIRLPKAFAAKRGIVEGSLIELDSIVATPRRRSSYRLRMMLKHYVKPPKHFDFSPVGNETA